MKKIILLFSLLAVSFLSNAQKITDGTWYNAEKTSRVQFYMDGDKLNCKIVWLKEPNANGKPRLDANNPKASLASKPLMGLVFLKDFEKEDENTWEEGTVYDPRNGKTYSCTITEIGTEKLEVRGYIGFSLLGRTSHLIRATR